VLADLAVRGATAGIRAAARHDNNAPQQTAPAKPAKPAPLPPGITGAMVLNDARKFAGEILYASDEMLDALTLAIAVTHTVDSFSTVPRLLFSSPEKESGKTTALDIVVMLASNGWMANPTSYALRAKFNEPERPTLVIDEISEVFGQSGLRGRSNPLGRILREGYRLSATLSMAVDRVAEDVSCFTVAAFAGLKTAVPDDIRSRSIVFPMKPLPDNISLPRDSQDSDTQEYGKVFNEQLHQWAGNAAAEIKHTFRNMRRPHPKFRARRAQIWGPLYAIALEAGEDWPARCMRAFKALALDASDMPVLSPAQMVLRDAASCFREAGAERLFGAAIKNYLLGLPDIELYGKLTDRALNRLIAEGLGPSESMDIGPQRARGFHAGPVLAAWDELEVMLYPRADDEPDPDDEETMFDVEDIPEPEPDITEVTDITDHGTDTAPLPRADGTGWV